MLAVVVSRLDWPGPRRFAYPGPGVAIGTDERNQLILSERGIAERHARVSLEAGALVLYEVELRGGVYVNDQRIKGKQLLADADRVQIASYTLVFHNVAVDTIDAHRSYVPDHPMERSLLQAIASRDDASRIVYADWLEQRGDRVRAEFLRVQDQLREDWRPGGELAVLVSRLRALAAEIEVAWRLQVADPDVERCGGAFRSCGMHWSVLQPTERDSVRHCTRREHDVYYALHVGEARGHARAGRCVALDVTGARWRGDLAEPFWERVCEQCKMDIGSAHRGDACPHCNHVVERELRYVCSNVLEDELEDELRRRRPE